MGLVVSSLSRGLRKRRRALVVEPVDEPVEEPSSKRPRAGADHASLLGAECRDIGIAEDSVRRETERKRLEVALFLNKRLRPRIGADHASLLGAKGRDIGIADDSIRQEKERKRLEVVLFLSGFTTAVPLPDGGIYYIETHRLEQFQVDHRREMYHWYMNQFRED